MSWNVNDAMQFIPEIRTVLITENCPVDAIEFGCYALEVANKPINNNQIFYTGYGHANGEIKLLELSLTVGITNIKEVLEIGKEKLIELAKNLVTASTGNKIDSIRLEDNERVFLSDYILIVANDSVIAPKAIKVFIMKETDEEEAFKLRHYILNAS